MSIEAAIKTINSNYKTAPEISEHLGVTREYVYFLAKKGKLETIEVKGIKLFKVL